MGTSKLFPYSFKFYNCVFDFWYLANWSIFPLTIFRLNFHQLCSKLIRNGNWFVNVVKQRIIVMMNNSVDFDFPIREKRLYIFREFFIRRKCVISGLHPVRYCYIDPIILRTRNSLGIWVINIDNKNGFWIIRRNL